MIQKLIQKTKFDDISKKTFYFFFVNLPFQSSFKQQESHFVKCKTVLIYMLVFFFIIYVCVLILYLYQE